MKALTYSLTQLLTFDIYVFNKVEHDKYEKCRNE